MTTSSPESEPHVEHTILANGIRQGPTGRLVLSQLHIGLAVGFAIVACLTAFGGGMIVGMWYKASEQSTPVSTSMTSTPAEQSAQSQETASQPARSAGTGDLLQYAYEQQRGLRAANAAGGDRAAPQGVPRGREQQPLLPGRQVARMRPPVGQPAIQKLQRPRKPRQRQRARRGLRHCVNRRNTRRLPCSKGGASGDHGVSWRH